MVECAVSLSGENTPWWAEPTATFEFEQVPSQFAKHTPEPDAASPSQQALPTLGPRVGLPPPLPLPLVEEEKAHHWPLEEAGHTPARHNLAGSLTGSKSEDAKACESSPSPCKGSSPSPCKGTSLMSTRSGSSRYPSSASTSMRSGAFEEERRPIVCPAIRWRISLDQVESRATIGLDLVDLPATKDREGALRVQDLQMPGLVSDWNGAHKNKEVRKGDYIVEVNGVHGGPDELREVLERDTFLDIMMLRGT